MPDCQRVFNSDFPEGLFAVTDVPDDQRVLDAGARLCGKPAFYKQVNGDVAIWICVDCFNEFEAQFGQGSWADTSRFSEGAQDDTSKFGFTEKNPEEDE